MAPSPPARQGESSPLLLRRAPSQRRSYESIPSSAKQPLGSSADAAVGITVATDGGDDCSGSAISAELYAALPKWFVALICASVVCTLTWIGGLVVVQHTRHFDVSAYGVSADVASSLYLYAGVLNSMMGSFLSASGYCCQKWAHNRVKLRPALGVASQQRVFLLGLFLLAVGTISAVLNLGILGQAVQAPFAALTLIYSALLGHFVLKEDFLVYDLFSSVLIVLGVAVDVYAAQLSSVPQQSYTLKTLGQLFFRDSIFPLGYAVLALTYTMLILRQVHNKNLHSRAIGLLAFSSCAGIMAGFTSLATKSAVEVSKSAVRHHNWDVLSPFFVLILLAIPSALIPQLFFLNKGLEYFGTLKFIPLYQAFIILGNMLCGLVFYNEMASYTFASVLCFLAGIVITLAGVCLLLVKVDSQHNQIRDLSALDSSVSLDQATVTATSPHSVAVMADPLATTFGFEQMEWARSEDVKTLRDFDACKQSIVRLLSAATASVFYSTFLCDFTQVLAHSDLDGEPITFISLVQAAVKRGVKVHILYNPVADYGTESVAELQQQLPSEVSLACCVSDLGPSVFTKCLSNNSKYAFHHQKYLLVDENALMVTGCDVNSEREGWLKPNALGYFWHELGVVMTRCSPKVVAWIKKNHAVNSSSSSPGTIGNVKTTFTKRHYDEFVDAAPFPLVSGGWREENAMVNMILHAEHSVHLENQILISGGSMQHNRICDAIIARIARAHRQRTPFHALILTNAAQQDEPSQVTRLYCSLSIQWSLEQLEDRALDNGLSLEQLREYLVVGRMEHDGVLVKVHSNILIVDGQYALRSSSNLADRSLSSRPTDTELGLLFAGDAVHNFEQELLNMYFGTTDACYSMADVFDRIRNRHRESCCIVPLEKKDWSPVFTWFLMNVFIYGSEGATGGRHKVSYETSIVSLRRETRRYDEKEGDSDELVSRAQTVAAMAC
ncbi:hypothetical protein Gpo141_00000299 [Globisporangium polare]